MTTRFSAPQTIPHSSSTAATQCSCRLSEDFQLLNYHFRHHCDQSSAGLSHRHWPCWPVLLPIRPDGIVSAQLVTEQIRAHCVNERTVVPAPALLETGTISSLALLGSLANLHCKDRSKTFLWNLKENRAYEQHKVQVLREFPGGWLEAIEHDSIRNNW